jgi:hypothetical protein
MSSKAPNLKDRLVGAAGAQPVRIAAAPAPVAPAPAEPAPRASVTPIAKARQGKTMVAGYFSPEFARAVKILAVEQGASVQALIGEALDELLRRHGKHPFGER